MATITKRKGKNGTSYLIRAYAGYDVTGKQIEKAMTWKPSPSMTQRQIEKAIQEQASLFENRLQSGLYLQGDIRFSEFAERWMVDYASKNLSLSTIEHSQGMLQRINLAIGHIRLDKLQPSHMIAFYNNLGEAGQRVNNCWAVSKPSLLKAKKKQKQTYMGIARLSGVSDHSVKKAFEGGRMKPQIANKISDALNVAYNDAFEVVHNNEKLSGATLNKYHRLISSILQTAVQWQVIPNNPARRVKAPKVVHSEAKYLDDEAVASLVEALQNVSIKWKTITLLLLYSGIRRGELCGLEWSDIDMENKLLHINRSSQYVRGIGIIEKKTKNRSSERVMKLPDYVFDLLKQYKSWQSTERLKFGDRWNNMIDIKLSDGSIQTRKNERLFTQDDGLPIDPNSITRWIKKFQHKHDLPEFTPHTLRHTNISLLIAANVPIRNIAQRAGHAQLSTTQNIYAHAFKTIDELAANALADALNSKIKAR